MTAKLAASVEVNGLWVPFHRLPETVRRFCVPALFLEDDPTFELTKSGSALLLHYRGRYFAICTKHQFGHANHSLGQKDPGRFSILLRGENGRFSALTPRMSGDVKVDNDDYAALNDLLILEFEVEQFGIARKNQFLRIDLSLTHDELIEQRAVASFAIGFPTYAVKYLLPEVDDVDRPHFDIPWVKLYLEDASDYEPQPLDPDNRRFMAQSERFKQKELSDPDGMSGAPVFTIWRSGGTVGYVFAGMVTHARGRIFAVYPAVRIRQALDTWLLA